MKALVIGGSGFLGSHLVDALLERGHQVRVFDRSPERFRQTPDAVEFQMGMLSDVAALAEALADMDQVFHFASTTVPSTSNLDPVADIEGNLINTVRLLKLMREGGVRRLVYLSSGGAVYGIPDRSPVPEDHPLRPISSYGIVKVAIENYLYMEQHLHGLQAEIPSVYVILRVGTGEAPLDVVLVTASPYEAQDYTDSGEEIVEKVAMPPALRVLVRDFVDRFYEEEAFVKRKRDKKRIDLVEDGIGDPRVGKAADVFASGRCDARFFAPRIQALLDLLSVDGRSVGDVHGSAERYRGERCV